MQPRTQRLALIFAAFTVGLVSMLAVIFVLTGRTPAPIATASAVGGPFTLTDQSGQKFSEQNLAGKPFLIFFGFTNCPDICPTALFDVSEVMRALGKDADKTQALFITVDPERDTAEKLRDYLSSFDKHLVGLTGTPEEIAAVLKTFRVYAKKVPTEKGDYTMDHTALIYLMDRNGKFVSPFRLNRRPEESAAELRRYL
jgi:protein SCO1/2